MKKEIKNNSFVFYATALETIEKLEETDQEMANELRRCILEYGIYGEYDSDNPIIEALMISIGYGIDKAKDRYKHSIENGKKGGRPSKINKAKVIELKKQGLTQKEIANNIGCSDRHIRNILKEELTGTNLNDNVNDNVYISSVPQSINDKRNRTNNVNKKNKTNIDIYVDEYKNNYDDLPYNAYNTYDKNGNKTINYIPEDDEDNMPF